MDGRYESWLRLTLEPGTVGSRMSNLQRIERAYGDLDLLYDRDGLQSLLRDLSYSKDDKRFNRPNPSKVAISGDVCNGLATLKSAVQKYALFRQQAAGEAASEPLESVVAAEETDDAGDGPALSLERDLQAALRRSIVQLEPGLAIIDGGQERLVPSGKIDILARDAQGRTVVIELKAVKAPRNAVAQLQAYMGDMMEPGGPSVRGLLVAPDFDAKAISAAKPVPSLTLLKYAFTFSFSPVT